MFDLNSAHIIPFGEIILWLDDGTNQFSLQVPKQQTARALGHIPLKKTMKRGGA
ncbi:hypothetical protein [Legionella cherrii]|uniref:hypothetical protein n=1 Tax=Legionella cherrii TaxID=28084 RepID=UPI000A5E154C|nr:hypothetical protein [Legionella cherrii]